MEVPTHEMDPRIARVHYGDYLKRCRAHREQRKHQLHERAAETGRELRSIQLEKTALEREDEELKVAYRELSRDHRIVLLPEAMRNAGVDSKSYLPQLAIAKADWEDVLFEGQQSRSRGRGRFAWGSRWATFSEVEYPGQQNQAVWLAPSTFPAETTDSAWRRRQREAGRAQVLRYPVRAPVPKIPPRLAPDDLSRYYILFEPRWEEVRPDPDPILLSRASETVFVVVATWDMTPLEAAAVGMRK